MELSQALAGKGLSTREIEVAELVTRGLSNRTVSANLFVTEKTIKFHLTNIYKKMAVKSRAELIVWCVPYLNFEKNPKLEEIIDAVEPEVATGGLASGSSKVSEL
jgi:DNA-binding CsgD family transcriptional regulator